MPTSKSESIPIFAMSGLSHILTASEACEILGESTVRNIVKAFLRYTSSLSAVGNGGNPSAKKGTAQAHDVPFWNFSHALDDKENEDETYWVDLLTATLAYDFEKKNDEEGNAIPAWCTAGWHRLMNLPPQFAYMNLTSYQLQNPQKLNALIPLPLLGMDKASFIRSGVVLPNCIAPNASKHGHLALMECIFYALATPSPSAILNRIAKASNVTSRSGTSTKALEDQVRNEYARFLIDHSQGNNYSMGVKNSRTIILLPDFIICLAITQRYSNLFMDTSSKVSGIVPRQDDQNEETRNISLSSPKRNTRITADGEKAIISLAELTFRIYDGFQKKSYLDRDTLHRFLSDIYGENSFSRENVKSVLDKMFVAKSVDDPNKMIELRDLNDSQYVRAIAKTVRIIDREGNKNSVLEHVLFDWFGKLGVAFKPDFLSHMDDFFVVSSTKAGVGALLISKLEIEERRSEELRLKKLFTTFGIVDEGIKGRPRSRYHRDNSMMDIFQVKRRFQSIVESGAKRKSTHGGEESLIGEGDAEDSDSSIEEEGHNLPLDENGSYIEQSSHDLDETPRNSIDQSNFIYIVSRGEDDNGHGGFITSKLASLLFRVGRSRSLQIADGGVLKSQVDTFLGIDSNIDCNQSMDSDVAERDYWELFDVLAFSCAAVRDITIKDNTADRLLMEYLFSMFLLLPDTTYTKEGIPKTIGLRRPNVLSRNQIGHMVLILLSQIAFRIRTDSPDCVDIDDFYTDNDSLEDVMVDSSAASILGIHPNMKDMNAESSRNQIKDGLMIPLSLIVDNIFFSIGIKDTTKMRDMSMSFDQFLSWSQISSTAVGLDASQIKIGPILLELRLIASIVFGVKPSSPSMEKTLVEEVNRRFKIKNPSSDHAKRGPVGTTWFIINATWWNEWELYSKLPSNNLCLPKINNNELLHSNGGLALKSGLRFKDDVILIPPLAWSALQAWHDGGPPIFRSVVPFKNINTHGKMQSDIELYPIFTTILLMDDCGDARPFQQYFSVSRYLPTKELLQNLCKSLNTDPRNGRLWMGPSYSGPNFPGNFDFTLDPELSLLENMKLNCTMDSEVDATKVTREIVLEMKTSQGNWPSENDEEFDGDENDSEQDISSSLGDGIVGLHNMGNTCFMNSSIQCISHTPILKEYFTSKSYLNDINKTNPLGYQGRLAQVSAVLISSLWKQKSRKRFVSQTARNGGPIDAPCLTPQTFKNTIGKLNSDFQGNEQHDAQELLTFLLGGLSEDLNRIVDKPYTEDPDSDGRPDKELADIWWTNHLKRELSIIGALFAGQYKSVLACKTCNYESARFEPFYFLQLPLPNDQVTVELVYFPLGKEGFATKFALKTKHDAKLFDVLFTLATVLYEEHSVIESEDDNGFRDISAKESWCLEKAKNMILVRIENGYISNIQSETWYVDKISNKETGEVPLLFVYEVDANLGEGPDGGENSDTVPADMIPRSPKTEYSFIAICQRKVELSNKPFLRMWYHKIFGTPFILRVPDLEGFTGRDLYDYVAEKVERYVPEKALRFLKGGSGIDKSYNDPKHLPGKLRTGRRQRNKTKDQAECSFFGPIPRYGFRLRVTTRDGKKCELCPWYECCIGCLITDDDYPSIAMNGDTVAIDWHVGVELATDSFDTLNNNPRANMLSNVKKHKTCHSGKNRYGRDIISLDDCLEAFTKEEMIPEAYCSKCKEFRVQSKIMNLWRLPPMMIIHLKRFQFNQHTKRKLRDFVHFPLEGLDLSSVRSQSKVNGKVTDRSDDQNDQSGKINPLYDLYGVIHHQGALGGGHYVASLKSEVDGKWRLFNDAQIYEVSGKDIIDSSAYILFYVRRDVKNATLKDFWDLQPREGEGAIEEELEKMVKQREKCIIS